MLMVQAAMLVMVAVMACDGDMDGNNLATSEGGDNVASEG